MQNARRAQHRARAAAGGHARLHRPPLRRDGLPAPRQDDPPRFWPRERKTAADGRAGLQMPRKTHLEAHQRSVPLNRGARHGHAAAGCQEQNQNQNQNQNRNPNQKQNQSPFARSARHDQPPPVRPADRKPWSRQLWNWRFALHRQRQDHPRPAGRRAARRGWAADRRADGACASSLPDAAPKTFPPAVRAQLARSRFASGRRPYPWNGASCAGPCRTARPEPKPHQPAAPVLGQPPDRALPPECPSAPAPVTQEEPSRGQRAQQDNVGQSVSACPPQRKGGKAQEAGKTQRQLGAPQNRPAKPGRSIRSADRRRPVTAADMAPQKQDGFREPGFRAGFRHFSKRLRSFIHRRIAVSFFCRSPVDPPPPSRYKPPHRSATKRRPPRRRLLGNRLTVDPRTLTPLVLVRIQVPQPLSNFPYFSNN